MKRFLTAALASVALLTAARTVPAQLELNVGAMYYYVLLPVVDEDGDPEISVFMINSELQYSIASQGWYPAEAQVSTIGLDLFSTVTMDVNGGLVLSFPTASGSISLCWIDNEGGKWECVQPCVNENDEKCAKKLAAKVAAAEALMVSMGRHKDPTKVCP